MGLWYTYPTRPRGRGRLKVQKQLPRPASRKAITTATQKVAAVDKRSSGLKDKWIRGLEEHFHRLLLTSKFKKIIFNEYTNKNSRINSLRGSQCEQLYPSNSQGIDQAKVP